MIAKIQAHDLVALKDGAVSAEIDGEVVALDVNTGICYGLDPIGSNIWRLLETPRTVPLRFPLNRPARHIRMRQTGADPVFYWTIAELHVYGS